MDFKTSVACIVCFCLSACTSDPSGSHQGQDITDNAGGAGGSGSQTGGAGGSQGTGGASTETVLERAIREFCEVGCTCYECGGGVEGCIHERADLPTGDAACDAVRAKQLDCITADLTQGCSDMEIPALMDACAPPMEEQEAACGPGGLN